MDRTFYLNLAAQGLRFPVGTDLVLHEHADAKELLLDAQRLGQVYIDTARRFRTPLALPHMDLELEKKTILAGMGIPPADRAQFHFSTVPGDEAFSCIGGALLPDMQAKVDAIRYVAECAGVLPIGMAIGPFSLMTKLVADPIAPVCMAGSGLTADDDEEIEMVEQVLELGSRFILRYIDAQIDAGAKAIFIAEPAANQVYFSPNQIDAGSDIFDRYAMQYNHRIKSLLDSRGVDLIFHCCGELTPYMVTRFTQLDPAMLSLSSSRRLWEDAALVPKTTVLYGNLPSKRFYSDELITVDQMMELGNTIIANMREAGHPFILGSECDVLSVPGYHDIIMRKAMAILECTG